MMPLLCGSSLSIQERWIAIQLTYICFFAGISRRPVLSLSELANLLDSFPPIGCQTTQRCCLFGKSALMFQRGVRGWP